jgi:hypothetical protein
MELRFDSKARIGAHVFRIISTYIVKVNEGSKLYRRGVPLEDAAIS